MSLTLYIVLTTILSLIISLATEGVKKAFPNFNKPTLLVIILSAVVGWGGGAITYILMGIPFATASIICLVLLAPTLFLVSTTGYDKVIELLKQIGLLVK